jgi:hypothetical protein
VPKGFTVDVEFVTATEAAWASTVHPHNERVER